MSFGIRHAVLLDQQPRVAQTQFIVRQIGSQQVFVESNRLFERLRSLNVFGENPGEALSSFGVIRLERQILTQLKLGVSIIFTGERLKRCITQELHGPRHLSIMDFANSDDGHAKNDRQNQGRARIQHAWSRAAF